MVLHKSVERGGTRKKLQSYNLSRCLGTWWKWLERKGTRESAGLVCSMARTPIKFQAGPRDLLNDVADCARLQSSSTR